MPKLTQEQIAKAKYVSMEDYYKKIEKIESFKEKLDFTTKYLLSHGMDGQPTDYSLEEAIHLTRLKLIDESKKARDRLFNDEEGPDPADLYIDEHNEVVDPYAEDIEDDIENEFFMANPGEYLKNKAQAYAKDVNENEISVGQQVRFEQNCARLAKTLNSQLSQEILRKEERGMSNLNIQARMEAKLGGRQGLQRAQNAIKPGFFTRAFGTRSNAGRNFDEVYAAFNNPNHALYGNKAALEKATVEYLDYKNSKKGPAERAVGLALKEPKEKFATILLEAIQEEKQNEEVFKPIVGGCVRAKIDQDKVDRTLGANPESNQQRVPIVIDLDDGENESFYSYDSDNSIEMENEKQDEEKDLMEIANDDSMMA